MVRGGLLTRYFLEDGIREVDAYRALNPAEVLAFAETVRDHWRNLEDMRRPNEAETEAEFIFPLLDELGWHHLPQQDPGEGRTLPTRCCFEVRRKRTPPVGWKAPNALSAALWLWRTSTRHPA